jgi:hypothetical protein
VRLGLGMERQGRIYALAGEPITLNGTTVPTDDNGEAEFSWGRATPWARWFLRRRSTCTMAAMS